MFGPNYNCHLIPLKTKYKIQIPFKVGPSNFNDFGVALHPHVEDLHPHSPSPQNEGVHAPRHSIFYILHILKALIHKRSWLFHSFLISFCIRLGRITAEIYEMIRIERKRDPKHLHFGRRRGGYEEAFKKWLGRYHKDIQVGRSYFDGDKAFWILLK